MPTAGMEEASGRLRTMRHPRGTGRGCQASRIRRSRTSTVRDGAWRGVRWIPAEDGPFSAGGGSPVVQPTVAHRKSGTAAQSPCARLALAHPASACMKMQGRECHDVSDLSAEPNCVGTGRLTREIASGVAARFRRRHHAPNQDGWPHRFRKDVPEHYEPARQTRTTVSA